MKSHDIISMKFQHSHTVDGMNPAITADQLRRLVVYPIIYRFSSINNRPGLVLSKKQLITPDSKKNGQKRLSQSCGCGMDAIGAIRRGRFPGRRCPEDVQLVS